MCTLGVSLYSSTASQPLSLFNARYLPTQEELYNLFRPRSASGFGESG